MLRSLKALEQYKVNATDGDIGSVVDFLLEDMRWTIRYLVVKAGGFFSDRQVLISPAFLREADWSTQRFHLTLTREKVKNSPDIDVDRPVSRQLENNYYRYYNYPYYWGSSGLWGMGAYPTSLAPGMWQGAPDYPDDEHRDAHLRSAKEVTGYKIRGSDGALGHVTDFIVDDATWQLRYLVVDASHWWQAGRDVLIAPYWATSVDWNRQEVHVDLSREAIKNSPAWDVSSVISRDYESRLYDHYGRPVYWDRAGGSPDKRFPAPSDSHHPA